jgi:cytoskeletal protein CcmA (bactofilin family)
MFGDREKLETDSIVGKGTEFKGTLTNGADIRIEGKFEGKIKVEGNVIVGEDAIVKADIQARSISIGGRVTGDVDCQGQVELLPSGRLKGKMKGSDLAIAEGASFNGECKMIPSSER